MDLLKQAQQEAQAAMLQSAADTLRNVVLLLLFFGWLLLGCVPPPKQEAVSPTLAAPQIAPMRESLPLPDNRSLSPVRYSMECGAGMFVCFDQDNWAAFIENWHILTAGR